MVILASFAVALGFLKMFLGTKVELIAAAEDRNFFLKKQNFRWLFRRFSQDKG